MASARTAPERRLAYAFTLGFFCETADSHGKSETLFVLPDELIAPDFKDNGNFDVLIGMDILSRGKLIFEGQDFSFAF